MKRLRSGGILISRSMFVAIACVVAAALVACHNNTTRLSAQPVTRPRSAVYASASDTVTITYVCGNTFRLTHNGMFNLDTSITWTTSLPQSGSVTLYKKLTGRSFTEALITTSSPDSLFIPGYAGLRKGNGGLATCTPPRDTGWTTATSLTAAYAMVDTSQKYAGPNVSDSLYARSAYVGAMPGMSRDTIAKVLASFGVRVVGQLRSGTMTIRFDLLRSNFPRYREALDSIAANSIFRFAQAALVNSSLEIRQNGRGRIDGGSFTRPN